MNFGNFFKGKKILVTGHTGFKGSWLSIWLKEMGADVAGYSIGTLYPNSLFDLANLKAKVADIRADIRDLGKLESVFREHKPEIVFHLAAQSLVRLSYDMPVETFSTNLIGTVNVLECLRKHPVKSAVIITSDKCYKNVEQKKGYVESDAFSDHDPYSSSKGCAETAAASYRNSFNLKAATARAGNVIGGGDWAKDRLVPDIMRALKGKKNIVVRNPASVRPWQFVLEPLSGYLLLAKKQYEGEDLSEGWNFGPERASMVPVKKLAEMIVKEWGFGKIAVQEDSSKPEAGLLYLDISKAKSRLGWKPRLDMAKTIKYIAEWYKNYENDDAYELCARQIKRYEAEK